MTQSGADDCSNLRRFADNRTLDLPFICGGFLTLTGPC
jgi:hypothetical protein